MANSEYPPLDVLYEMQVAAHLSYDEMGDRLDWPAMVHDDHVSRFMDDEIMAWNERIEHLSELADIEDEFQFVAPHYLLDKLAQLADSIRTLEQFRDDLITFTRTYAIDPESARVIAARTELSHTTIMRIGNDEARRAAVAAIANRVAQRSLKELTPRSDPDLYGRLTAITTQTQNPPRS